MTENGWNYNLRQLRHGDYVLVSYRTTYGSTDVAAVLYAETNGFWERNHVFTDAAGEKVEGVYAWRPMPDAAPLRDK